MSIPFVFLSVLMPLNKPKLCSGLLDCDESALPALCGLLGRSSGRQSSMAKVTLRNPEFCETKTHEYSTVRPDRWQTLVVSEP